MSQDANNPQANVPTQPPNAPVSVSGPESPDDARANVATPRSMNSVASTAPRGSSPLKLIVPIVVLMAVVFGVTFFAQYTPKTDDDKAGSGGDAGGAGNEPPLRFGTSTRQWNPFSSSPQDQSFPGFYEVGPTLHGASFWFENRNTKPVSIQLKGISCTSCSGGRLAPIPNDVTRQLLQMTAVSILPQGLVTVLPGGMIGPAANLSPDRLEWQEYEYKDNPHAQYRIPAAENTEGWLPSRWATSQWGILELRFKVTAAGPAKPLMAEFTTQVDGTKQTGTDRFTIQFEGVSPIELSRTYIDVGEMLENSEPRKAEFLVYSTTRGPSRTGPDDHGDLAPPTTVIRTPTNSGEPGPFVSVAQPMRVPEAELLQLSMDLSNQFKKPVRVESAYRFVVNVTPKVGDARVDVGLLERDVTLVVPDSEAKSVRVKAMIRGPVWLDNGRTDVEVPSYRVSEGTSLSVKLITEQRDAVVSLVAEECSPTFLKVEYEKLPPAADRGYHAIKVTIPKNGKTGSWSGVLVLEIKGQGPTPQRIRIPIRGSTRF